jgi:Uri superfamily endonuclease
LSVQQKKFWHIDFIKTYLTPVGYFYSDQIDKECEWVQIFNKSGKIEIPIMNFGSSDCKNKCGAHLLMISNSNLDFLKEIITHSECNYDQFIFLSG